ncbi:hypothetical protein [Butyrivibrio sp. JL13D10]|uniref:hypothetical protein n=1 Tax=Butyrivibrio sp. JL13D10 TaxID=3236815 RepID=UPI0038B63CA7
MGKLSNSRGVSRILVLAIVIAIALIVVVIVKSFNGKTDDALEDMDRQVQITAEHEARLLYTQNDLLEKMVYDAQNKTFVEPEEAVIKVEPYGSSEDHKGKYLLIIFGDDQKVTSKWVKP